MYKILTLMRPLIISTALLIVSATHSVRAEQPTIVIGTGGISGVYYHAGRAICAQLKKQGMACTPKITDGSVDNINLMRDGKITFGIVQSDTLHNAYLGAGKFKGQAPYTGLRTVFSLHAEPFTVVAGTWANITKLQDLKGKRVNIGSPGSGSRGTMEDVMGGSAGISPPLAAPWR